MALWNTKVIFNYIDHSGETAPIRFNGIEFNDADPAPFFAAVDAAKSAIDNITLLNHVDTKIQIVHSESVPSLPTETNAQREYQIKVSALGTDGEHFRTYIPGPDPAEIQYGAGTDGLVLTHPSVAAYKSAIENLARSSRLNSIEIQKMVTGTGKN